MSNFHCVSLVAGKRLKYMSFKSKNMGEALVKFAKNSYPDEVFDGVNHVKTFLKNEFKEFVFDEKICSFVNGGNQTLLSADLEGVMEKISDKFEKPIV